MRLPFHCFCSPPPQRQLHLRGGVPAGHLHRAPPHRQAPDRDRPGGGRALRGGAKSKLPFSLAAGAVAGAWRVLCCCRSPVPPPLCCRCLPRLRSPPTCGSHPSPPHPTLPHPAAPGGRRRRVARRHRQGQRPSALRAGVSLFLTQLNWATLILLEACALRAGASAGLVARQPCCDLRPAALPSWARS